MTEEERQQIGQALRAITAASLTAATEIDVAVRSLTHLLDIELYGRSDRRYAPSLETTIVIPGHPHLVIHVASLSVSWHGKRCFLGNTLVFRLFVRLAKTPNQFVSHQQLLDDVWQGRRVRTTIRGVVKRLRDTLSAAGMQDLAKAIDGSTRGHYRLKLV